MYEQFEKLLIANNVKAADVAKATGIAPSSLTDWKKGRSMPKLDKLQIIADYFDVKLDYLLGTNDEPLVKGSRVSKKLITKIAGLNDANLTLLENMIDTMLKSQN